VKTPATGGLATAHHRPVFDKHPLLFDSI